MTRYLPFVVLIEVLAAIAAITPATASANDAAVVTSVKAVQNLAGKSELDVTPIVNQAIVHANNGSIQLKNANALIRKVR